MGLETHVLRIPKRKLMRYSAVKTRRYYGCGCDKNSGNAVDNPFHENEINRIVKNKNLIYIEEKKEYACTYTTKRRVRT